ncbi:putative bifunctional diguanylate cyclase/phosphodiesterase [Marinobacter qingdaonensis]|uniref:EAL domain-containing protein n=1 Tax=Marinobacter qingdaonensis TaxID=3108486 RepID=A0ABU5NUU0_9GAMM|nr:EAL domain-containing protein [Marinobacter sp. ASW11-75]MEA1079576.1 EAL domain-containing protein [Marinobacter sp. ASW11-75]
MKSNTETETPVYSSSAHHLLVVDDDIAVRIVARAALEKAGFVVTEVSDGSSAIRWLQTRVFDAVLLDARMPGLNGFDTCKAMRKFLKDDPVPIILATGQDDDDSIEHAFECGATDFAPKPLNWRITIQRLKSLIRARESENREKARADQVTRMLKSSSEAALTLDPNGIIIDRHHLERIDQAFSSVLLPGLSLFDVLSGSAKLEAQEGWKASETMAGGEPFFIRSTQQHDMLIQGRFVLGVDGERFCLFNDLTESWLADKKMYELVYRDACTQLGNLNFITRELNAQFEHDVENVGHTGLLRFIASNFSSYESRIGRAGLNDLAALIANRMRDVVANQGPLQDRGKRPALARIGDSEFMIALFGITDENVSAEMASCVYAALNRPYEVNGYTFSLTWKAGVTDTMKSVPVADGFIAATACAANMNEAAGVPVSVYNEDVRLDIQRDYEIERLLRRDVLRGRLEMHYQPKFSLTSMTLVGMEALIRWNCKELGPVSPAVFIPAAERCGLIVPLSQFVIQEVLDQMVDWRNQGRPSVPVSINISGSHLNTGEFTRELHDAIAEREIDQSLVELEVTEAVMVDAGSRAVFNLEALRATGVRVSVDDFGTGYSSLSYLKNLPVDCLKIDRSFVQNITHDNTALAIAKAIITVGHEVGLHVIAEGVETPEQLDCLKLLGCDSVQGFLTGRPVDKAAFDQFYEGPASKSVAA